MSRPTYRYPACHAEWQGSYVDRSILRAVGVAGRLSSKPADAAALCPSRPRTTSPSGTGCRCVTPKLNATALIEFYGTQVPPLLPPPPLLAFGEGALDARAFGSRTVTRATRRSSSTRSEAVPLAVSRIGFPGDGINAMCSGGSLLHGVLSIGKARQLGCRREFARQSGCTFEKLALQAPQYDLELPDDCAAFTAAARASSSGWLIKPAVSSYGRGIRYVTPAEAAREAERLCWRNPTPMPGERPPVHQIVMQYVEPITIGGGRKFDLRTYLLIGRTRPLVAYYHRGFARLAELPYDRDSADVRRHVTNVAGESKPDAGGLPHFMSIDRMARALREEHGFGATYLDRLEDRMRRISLFVLQTMRDRTAPPRPAAGADTGAHETLASTGAAGRRSGPGRAPPIGSWQVFGLDWVIGEKGDVSLLECNAAPGLKHYEIDDHSTPAVYTSMLELVGLTHSAPASKIMAMNVTSHFRYRGWQLLFNEWTSPRTYRACHVPGLHE